MSLLSIFIVSRINAQGKKVTGNAILTEHSLLPPAYIGTDNLLVCHQD